MFKACNSKFGVDIASSLVVRLPQLGELLLHMPRQDVLNQEVIHGLDVTCIMAIQELKY